MVWFLDFSWNIYVMTVMYQRKKFPYLYSTLFMFDRVFSMFRIDFKGGFEQSKPTQTSPQGSKGDALLSHGDGFFL
jgi:hypothetical protein